MKDHERGLDGWRKGALHAGGRPGPAQSATQGASA